MQIVAESEILFLMGRYVKYTSLGFSTLLGQAAPQAVQK